MAQLDRTELRTRIAEILDVDESMLTDDAHFMDNLGVDSLMALEVMVVLENTYRVKFEESQLAEMTSFERVYAVLDAQLDKQAAV